MSPLRYSPVKPAADGPRCFLAFEDRGRDVSGLLEFGTVCQLFEGGVPWQLTTDHAAEFCRAVDAYFATYGFNDDDFVVGMGDPAVIAALVSIAAGRNIAAGGAGIVTVLKWDKLPCARCGRYRDRACDDHRLSGRYVPIALPLDATSYE